MNDPLPVPYRSLPHVHLKASPDYHRALLQCNTRNLPSDLSLLPDAIVLAQSVQDVVTVVQFAKQHNLKVSIRGGGGSWIHAWLRHGTHILLDVKGLNDLQIDEQNMIAIVQVGCKGSDVLKELEKRDFAYPAGHCEQVHLSGYVLWGGMGFNSNVWGPACLNVLAMDLVTPDGDLITADPNHHTDWFWLRGAGAAFPAVVVQYTLRIYTKPKIMRMSAYLWKLSDMPEVVQWLDENYNRIPKYIEHNGNIHRSPQVAPFVDRESSCHENTIVSTSTGTSISTNTSEDDNDHTLFYSMYFIAFCDSPSELDIGLHAIETSDIIGSCVDQKQRLVIHNISDLYAIHTNHRWPVSPDYRAAVSMYGTAASLNSVYNTHPQLTQILQRIPREAQFVVLVILLPRVSEEEEEEEEHSPSSGSETVTSCPCALSMSASGRFMIAPYVFWKNPDLDQLCNQIVHDFMDVIPKGDDHRDRAPISEFDFRNVQPARLANLAFSKPVAEKITQLANKFNPKGTILYQKLHY